MTKFYFHNAVKNRLAHQAAEIGFVYLVIRGLKFEK